MKGCSKTGKQRSKTFLTHFCMIFDAFLACQMTQFTLDDTLCRLIFQVHFLCTYRTSTWFRTSILMSTLSWFGTSYPDLEHPILISNIYPDFEHPFTEKLHKMKLRILNLIIPLKLELSPQNIHIRPLLCILFD